MKLRSLIFITIVGTIQIVSAQKLSVKEVANNAISQMQVAGSPILTYNIRFAGTGSVAFFPQQHMQVTIHTSSKLGTYEKAYMQGKVIRKTPQGVQTKNVRIALNNQVVRSLDENKKVLWEAPMYRGGANLMLGSMSLYAYELLPQLKQAVGKDARLLTDQKINGQQCYVITYVTEAKMTFWWYINKKSFKVCKMEASKTEWGSGKIGGIVSNINNTKRLPEHQFRVSLPQGYKLEQFTGKYPKIGSEAPNWTLQSYNGKSVSLKDLRGKVVVLDFWATWCLPCIKSIPKTEAFHQKFKKYPVKIIGITWREKGKPTAMIRKKKVSYLNLKGDLANDPLGKQYNLVQSGLPIAYVISPEGKIIDFFLGSEAIKERLEATITKTLKKYKLYKQK